MYKPGQMVTCEVKSEQNGGYGVEILPERQPGTLRTASILPLGRVVTAAFVAAAGEQMLFMEYKGDKPRKIIDMLDVPADHPVRKALIESIAQQCKVDPSQVENMTFGDAAEKANAVHLGLDLNTLTGSFEENLAVVLEAWQGISKEDALAAVNQSGLMTDGLRKMGLLTQMQFETIQKGQEMVSRGDITFRQFAVCYRDELDGAVKFQEVLEVRHWVG